MKLLKKWLNKRALARIKESEYRKWEHEIIQYRKGFMEATARNAARDVLGHFIAAHSLGWWRSAIDEADKSNEKYQSLASILCREEARRTKNE